MEYQINTEGLPKEFSTLLEETASAVEEAHKFYSKGNKSATTRSRKHLANVAKACKEARQKLLTDRS